MCLQNLTILVVFFTFISDLFTQTRVCSARAIEKTDERYPGTDPRYRNLREGDLPITESMKDTFCRLLPYWKNTIVPEIRSGKR
jgi:bisphosphoglycerate-dependent phosphoglycerate mutase